MRPTRIFDVEVSCTSALRTYSQKTLMMLLNVFSEPIKSSIRAIEIDIYIISGENKEKIKQWKKNPTFL